VLASCRTVRLRRFGARLHTESTRRLGTCPTRNALLSTLVISAPQLHHCASMVENTPDNKLGLVGCRSTRFAGMVMR
jgi:hypothetical protein